MSVLRTLFAHNDWARDKVMELASPMSDEQLDRPFEMGPGSLRRTVQHMWACEQHWLNRWRGMAGLGTEPNLAMDVLWDRFRKTAVERDALFDSVGEPGFSNKISFTADSGETHTFPLGDMVLHVSNHGVHHRAQALNMLRRLGVKVPGIDFLHLRVERPTVEFDEAGRAKLGEMGMAPGATLAAPDELDVETIREYYRYSDWATLLLCDHAEKLTDERLDRAFEMGIGTLRKTLLHIYDAEAWWCANWTDAENKAYQQLPPTTSIAELKVLLETHIAARDGFFVTLTAAKLQEVISAEVTPDLWLRFRLGETMLQLPPHGTHHRAQCRNMLRHLAVETQEIDYLDWYDTTQR